MPIHISYNCLVPKYMENIPIGVQTKLLNIEKGVSA